MFRHSGVKLEAQVGVSPPGTLDGSYSRTGPILFAVLDANRWECVPCFTPVLGRGGAAAVFNVATAEVGQLLRWFERAECVDRRGRVFAFAGGRAWAYLRWRRGFFEAPRLR